MPRGLAAGVLQSALWTCGWDIVRGRLFTSPYLMRSLCASPSSAAFSFLYVLIFISLPLPSSSIQALRLLVLSLFVLAAFLAHTRACVRSRHRRAHTPSRRSVLGLDTDMLPSCRHRLSPRLLDAAPSNLDAAICALAVAVVHAPPRRGAYVHALFDAAMRTMVLDADLRPPSTPACPRSSPQVLRRQHVRYRRRRRHHGSPRHCQTLVLVIHALLLTAGYERPSTPPSPSVGGRAHTAPAAIWDGQFGADIQEAVLVVLVVGREALGGGGDTDLHLDLHAWALCWMAGGRASKICNAIGAPAPGGARGVGRSVGRGDGDTHLQLCLQGDLALLVVGYGPHLALLVMQLLRHPILVSLDVDSDARGASREFALSRARRLEAARISGAAVPFRARSHAAPVADVPPALSGCATWCGYEIRWCY
ncbi:hypothetical protein B0H10DRAFT_2244580 [Mycena sp. CBHHK59/15]|nr:hypothetical protein B0H10DRAFT_2244580 [Mycena sp. CBHHK59/15]